MEVSIFLIIEVYDIIFFGPSLLLTVSKRDMQHIICSAAKAWSAQCILVLNKPLEHFLSKTFLQKGAGIYVSVKYCTCI